MKTFILAVALSLATVAHAAQIDTSALTPAQVEALAAQAKQMAAESANAPKNISATVRSEAEAWGELGANMGKAMVGAAKEVGIAANEFSQTPLGRIVVFLAAYKIIGEDVLGVIFGTLIMVFGYSLGVWIALTRRWSAVTYEYKPILWGLINKKVVTSQKTNDEIVVTKVMAAAFLLVMTTVVGLNIIF